MLTQYMLWLCVCLCLSVTSWSSTITAQWIQLILAWRLPSTYPTLWFKEIWVTPKIKVLPSGTLSKMLDLNFVVAAVLVSAVNKSIKTMVGYLLDLCHIELAGAVNKATS